MHFDFLSSRFLGNPLEAWLWFLAIIFTGLLLRNFLSRLLSKLCFNLLKKYFKSVGVEKFVSLLSRPVSFFILVLIIYIASNRLEFPQEWHLVPRHEFGLRMSIFKIFETLLVFSFTWILLRLADYFGLVLLYRARQTEGRYDDQLVPFLKGGVKIFLFVIAMLFILGHVFELNVTSIVAGLGIGGLAIALASKDTLENLLGSFLIFIDKPFTIGDMVKVGSVQGNVEEIGFRSTKIRTLDKTFITVPNKKMIDAELENQTVRTYARCRTIIALTYSSTKTQIQSIVNGLQQVLNNHKMVKDGATVFFTNFGSSSLEIEIIYLVKTTNMDEFAAIRQEINFLIMEMVEKHGCSFAFPTQTVYLHKEQE